MRGAAATCWNSVARDAQLRALRAQLNPHFLFNCLNSVRSLIAEDPQRAASMITGLAEILRYSLASDREDTVSLADELDVIDEYVGLERMRFEERLQVERAIEPAALAGARAADARADAGRKRREARHRRAAAGRRRASRRSRARRSRRDRRHQLRPIQAAGGRERLSGFATRRSGCGCCTAIARR